jgi:hypothetical protein
LAPLFIFWCSRPQPPGSWGWSTHLAANFSILEGALQMTTRPGHIKFDKSSCLPWLGRNCPYQYHGLWRGRRCLTKHHNVKRSVPLQKRTFSISSS